MTKLDGCFHNCHIYLAIVSWDDTEYGGSYAENPLLLFCIIQDVD